MTVKWGCLTRVASARGLTHRRCRGRAALVALDEPRRHHHLHRLFDGEIALDELVGTHQRQYSGRRIRRGGDEDVPPAVIFAELRLPGHEPDHQALFVRETHEHDAAEAL